MRAFGIRPKRDLGQNFLIDSNLLDVIARAAELGPDDVVLEVGGGLGVLSEHLAERVAHVHVVELDRTLEPALRDALDAHPNTTLHFADAVKLDLAALEPCGEVRPRRHHDVLESRAVCVHVVPTIAKGRGTVKPWESRRTRRRGLHRRRRRHPY